LFLLLLSKFKKKIINKKKKQKKKFLFIFLKQNDFEIELGKKINVSKLISYEIICAPPRNLPKNEYFDLLPHPEKRIVYIKIEDTHK